MPLFFFLPLIVATGMLEVMLTGHELDERNAPQEDGPADLLTTKGENIIDFPNAA